MSNVVDHPAAALMAEVEAERAIEDTPEAQALQDAICDALRAYYVYLDRHGLFYNVETERGASALHIIYDGWSYQIIPKEGAIDRRYGDSPGAGSPWRHPT